MQLNGYNKLLHNSRLSIILFHYTSYMSVIHSPLYFVLRVTLFGSDNILVKAVIQCWWNEKMPCGCNAMRAHIVCPKK